MVSTQFMASPNQAVEWRGETACCLSEGIPEGCSHLVCNCSNYLHSRSEGLKPQLKPVRLLRLCDEATSALDSSTEADILSALKTLAQNRTAIFVTHRLTTAQQCDEVCLNFSLSMLFSFSFPFSQLGNAVLTTFASDLCAGQRWSSGEWNAR